MLPSRCVRCGAVSREFLCASCVDYLIAYRPLWLDPALLPGPSLLDLVGSREVALLADDLSQVEWRGPRAEASSADAVRLVKLLGLEEGTRPVLSVGDAEILHAFLKDARRASPADPNQRGALAALYRYLSSCDWMPPHLASEYRARANVLEPRIETPEAPAGADVGTEEIPPPSPAPAAPGAPPEPSPPLPETPMEPKPGEPGEVSPEEPAEDLEPLDEITLPPTEIPPPEPVPLPETPLPILQRSPEPEPEPEEPAVGAARQTDMEAIQQSLAKERADVGAWIRSRTEELQAKEAALADRERTLASKEREVEDRARAATERLIALEKDEVRREVLRFLGTIPGMSAAEADVIATAFPDMASLRAADVKALTQCKGVTENLARGIRFELVPGEVEDEDRAIQLREEAQSFLEEGDYEAALACYNRLLRERPEDMSLWFDRAELLVLLDRPAEALQCYTRVLDFDAGNRQARFERANLLFGLGRLADAIEALRETLRIDPARASDITLKAEQLRRDGHPNEAAVLFQAVLDVDPNDARAILGLGDSLLDLGDTDAAEALFTRALGQNPQNPPILYRKGELLARKGRWGAAIQYHNRAIALQWKFAEPWLAKGEILLHQGRAKEALECFRKVLSFDPERVEAWAGKARACVGLGNRAEAEEALKGAARLDANHPSVQKAREALAEVAPPKAEAPPRKESASEPPSLAKAFEEMEEEPEAKSPAASDFQSFVESIEPDKEDTHVLLQLAELALEGGDPRMALLRYDQAIQREARNADAWTGKGVALQQIERYREALDAYDRALSLDPNHALARKWRATCVRHLEREVGG